MVLVLAVALSLAAHTVAQHTALSQQERLLQELLLTVGGGQELHGLVWSARCSEVK